LLGFRAEEMVEFLHEFFANQLISLLKFLGNLGLELVLSIVQLLELFLHLLQFLLVKCQTHFSGRLLFFFVRFRVLPLFVSQAFRFVFIIEVIFVIIIIRPMVLIFIELLFIVN
jgi:hypothetical protein